MNHTFTDKEYWNTHFGVQELMKFPVKHKFNRYFKKYITKNDNKSLIEIGSFPGTTLGFLAKQYGVHPTALDFLDNANHIVKIMEFNGIDNCTLINEDFLLWKNDCLFDYVLSMGFVEHFENYEEIIKKHITLLKPGGTLFISVPLLNKFQLFVRKLLYKPSYLKEILASHNLKIMDLNELKRIVVNEKLILNESSYVDNMRLSIKRDRHTLKSNMMWLYQIFKKSTELLSLLRLSGKNVSPLAIIIATKPNNEK